MIDAAFLDGVLAIIGRAGLSTESVAALRDAFPALHFTYCHDDDIGTGIAPVRTADGFNLYLVDGRDHCIRFTSDLANATGLVLAEVELDAPADPPA
ncbi:MAG: hypothetical protein EA400_17450 [Chromatiaceae bacterium]|nr:MAG: hypothetical protein EA400_17450 [Chromatiaceae bacterium]